MAKLEDTDIMPFGKYQGHKMEDVPAYYLLWLLEKPKRVGESAVREYVEDNKEVLEKQVKESRSK